jgi:cytochrome P450
LVTGDLAVADRFLDDYTRHPLVLKTALQPLTGGSRGLVSLDMSEWYGSRTAIRTAFSVTNVQRFVPDIAQYSIELREALLRHATTGRRFPMIEPIEKWGADLTFRFLLGDDAAVQQGGWGTQINTDVQSIIAQIDNRFSWNPWIYRQRKKALGCCKERVRSKIRTALNDTLRREQPAARNQFVPLLDLLTAKYVEEYPERTDWDADTMAQHLDTVMTMFLAADVSSMVLTVATPLLFPFLFLPCYP